MDYIRLEILTSSGWLPLSLPDDTSISMQETSPLWGNGDGGAFSIPFTVDIDDNLPFFGNTAEGHGSSIVKLLYNAKFRLYCGNVFFKSGIVKLDDSVEVQYDDNGHRQVEISLESSRKEFDEILDGVKVRDLNIEQYNIQIGYCLPDELEFSGKYNHVVYSKPKWNSQAQKYEEKVTLAETIDYKNSISLPKCCVTNYHDRMHGGRYTKDFTNVQYPYNPNNPAEHPFCNVRACYQKYVWDNDNKQWKTERGTSIGETDRVNSAPCFYFGFVHDELFKQLNITITENPLNNMLDYRRLAFWHTNCMYKATPVDGATYDRENQDNKITFHAFYASGKQYRYYFSYKSDDDWKHYFELHRSITPDYQLCRAVATSENLPDIEAKDMVEAMTSAFGARYIFDASSNTLRIILVKDVLSSKTTTRLDIDVIGNITKTENTKKGFILKYSSSSEETQNSVTKAANIAVGGDSGDVVVADASTTYNYNDFRFPYVIGMGMATYNETTKQLEYDLTEHPVTDYQSMLQSINNREMRLFLDTKTGNAYRVKVDGGANTQAEWYPSLFQVAAFRDVKIGDCSDEDRVETVSIPFSPAIPNDANFYKQYKAIQEEGGSEDGTEPDDEDRKIPSPIYAQFINGEIHHHDDDNLIQRDYMYNALTVAELYDYKAGRTNISCHIDVKLELKAVEDYEVGNGNEGAYYQEEAGFVLGLMRGSGSDAHTIIYEENYDGEGHSHYTMSQGSDAEFTPDTMDVYGNMFDYNGDGTLIKVINKTEAKMYLISYFRDSNPDLTTPTRVVTAAKMQEYGWSIQGNYATACTMSRYMTDYDGKEYIFMLTPINDEGNVITRADLVAYTDELISLTQQTKQSILACDAENRRLVIGRYDTVKQEADMDVFLVGLHNVWYGSSETGTVSFPDNGLGYDVDDLISLKLKTEIPIDGDPNKGYYPITNPLAQKRGIADKFYGLYSYWVLNAKTATIPCIISSNKLKELDWFSRYDINGYVGFLYRKTYNITQEGIKDVKLEHKYL